MGAKLAEKRKQRLNRERQRRYRERQKALANGAENVTQSVTPTVTSGVTPEVAEVIARYRPLFDKYPAVPVHQQLATLLNLTAMLASDNPQAKVQAFQSIGVGFGIIAPPQPVPAPAEEEPEELPPMPDNSPPPNPVLDVLMRH